MIGGISAQLYLLMGCFVDLLCCTKRSTICSHSSNNLLQTRWLKASLFNLCLFGGCLVDLLCWPVCANFPLESRKNLSKTWWLKASLPNPLCWRVAFWASVVLKTVHILQSIQQNMAESLVVEGLPVQPLFVWWLLRWSSVLACLCKFPP